ncbi:MAG: radical SAM protein [Thiomargarita sp.]|nr:radical SAM protein [Thiomargarita sp.]
MADIIFVNPPYERIAPGYDFVRQITNHAPSLGLLHLAAQVRVDGYDPMIIESDIEQLSVSQVAARIIQIQPRYLGITLFTVGVSSAIEIAREVKCHLANIIILVGGPHMSSMGMETMQRFQDFDIAVLHEGESVISALLPILDQGKKPLTVKGILYRMGDHIMETPQAMIQKKLDDLPRPAWDLLPQFPEAYLPAIYDYPTGPVATIAASRGCPFHCKFCDTATFGNQVRTYTPQAVFNMMQHLNQTYGIRHIMFVDDLFVASRIRVLKLCELIINNKLKITWSCTARVDTVKPDVLKKMKAAGCWEISFGLETGSNALLQKMDKAVRVETSEQAILWTHEAGIRCKGLLMLGYPGETLETIAETKAFLKRIPLTTLNLSKFTPYPGSAIYQTLYGTHMRAEDWRRMNGMNFLWTPEGFTKAALDQEYKNLLLSFYLRPKIMMKYFLFSITYPKQFIRLLPFLWGYFQSQGLRLKKLMFFNGT